MIMGVTSIQRILFVSIFFVFGGFSFAQKLDIVAEQEEMMVRLHQHVGFQLGYA